MDTERTDSDISKENEDNCPEHPPLDPLVTEIPLNSSTAAHTPKSLPCSNEVFSLQNTGILDSVQSSVSAEPQDQLPGGHKRSFSPFRIFSSHSINSSTSTSIPISSNDKLPRLSFDSSYTDTLSTRAESILHITPAIKKKVFIRNRFSIARRSIILGNGLVYFPEVTIKHDETGMIMQARRLRRQYGIYSLDPTQPPVAIQLLLKSAVSEAIQFEDKDYQLALRIQSDLTNQRDNNHVVKLFHLMETPSHIIAVRELVNGDVEEYGEWIRTTHLVQNVFKQVIEGYSRLLKIGYYHCNLCLENILLLLQANPSNPESPILYIKLTGFEEAVPIQSNCTLIQFQEHMKGQTSYIAPECFDDSYYAKFADLWSLGVILFALLTGEVPFDICNSSDPVFSRFIDGGFSVIQSLLDEVQADPNAIDLIRQLLVIVPEKRISLSEMKKHPYLQ